MPGPEEAVWTRGRYSWGYKQLQKIKDSLTDCFENGNIIIWTGGHYNKKTKWIFEIQITLFTTGINWNFTKAFDLNKYYLIGTDCQLQVSFRDFLISNWCRIERFINIRPTWACMCHWLRQERNRFWKRWINFMRGSRKFCQRGFKLNVFFFYFSWWGDRESQYHYKCVIMGPSAKRHLNGASLTGRRWLNVECWLGSFVIFQGIRTSIAMKENLYFCDFSGGGGSGIPVPPLDPPMNLTDPWPQCTEHETAQASTRENMSLCLQLGSA